MAMLRWSKPSYKQGPISTIKIRYNSLSLAGTKYINFDNTFCPFQWGQTVVYHASAHGHTEVVQCLIQAKANLELQTEV